MSREKRPWQTLSAHRVFDTPYLKVRREEVLLPNGTVIPDYYIIENRGWVGIVPLTADGSFVLNKQYKHGIGQEVLEFPAGLIEEHEDDPLLTAQRELMEETGYSCAPEQIELLSHMLANPTGAVTRIWWYLARDVRKTGEQKLDPAEFIDNFLVTPAELLNLIHSGAFAVQGQIAAAYLALERLGILRTTL
ncbi:NUDIX hydrolase [Ktedonosporobacter rubrisoli]|uniref:NUDIX hydrolase n=1 Tax=Ktedonosporobacter rubrisoli TaxID=2509675 RepID=A0A4V0YZP9_KTERU|nr:NUDIX hydrolase [Ktedonosporobacter rubrisoli]QBD80481.1 NUDIX hydrolase [Ktedonosporobacter rubrisoli]